MKFFTVFSFLALSGFIFNTHADAQLFEDFESGTLTSYPSEPQAVELETGVWLFHQALLGRDDRDQKNGEQSARLRTSGATNGSITMDFDKTNGAGTVSFLFANSTFFGDGDGQIQLQYSTDQGDSWNDAGPELEVPDQLQTAEIAINQTGNIRFRIVHTGGGRLNIDDFSVTDFSDDASIVVTKNNTNIALGSTLDVNLTPIGSVRTSQLIIGNNGNQTLEVSSIEVSGETFSLVSGGAVTLEPGESSTTTISFTPPSEGVFEGNLTIFSNASNHPEFSIDLEGEGFERNVISISEARDLPIGTQVSVGGWITALDEFHGPLFFEDLFAGIGWYNEDLMRGNQFFVNASHGDSIVVTATLKEVDTLGGQPGTGLLKLGGDRFEFEVFPESNKDIMPILISVDQLSRGDFRGRLVRINSASFTSGGIFQANSQYSISDRTSGAGRFRVNQFTNLSGTSIPSQRSGLIGIVWQRNGNSELQARSTDDIDPVAHVYPGDDIPQEHTLDVVTWNIEWFGFDGEGPINNELQFQNVKTVIETLNADVYAFQEIANNAVYNQLANELEGYTGLIANYTQTQKTAYLYRESTINRLNFGLLSAGQNSFDWAGRLPFWLHYIATISGHEIEIHSYNLHAKAFSNPQSYNRRVNASNQLKTFLDNNRPNANVVVLGDYNDNVTTSTRGGGFPSPYQNFMDDPNYNVVTSSLELAGFASFEFSSMIDHITFTNELIEAHIDGAERVDDTSTYIGNYLNTTSDHFPVLTRFYFGTTTSIDEPVVEIPNRITLSQNYPNPFNPSTNIRFSLETDEVVNLTVYDVMGRHVATLVAGEHRNAGSHTVTFNATGLATGMYLYRLQTSSGYSLTNKMMFIK